MTTSFSVTPTSYKNIQEVPEVWKKEDFLKILELTDYGDVTDLSDAEIKEMAMLSIADLDRPEAATLLLEYHFGERLNAGQIQSAAHEMEDEKLWEEYPDMAFHEGMFYVGSLLYKSYNGGFPMPDAVQVSIEVKGENTVSKELLKHPTEALVVRLLAKGMPENSLLHRMFEDELKGDHFPDAPSIIWTMKHQQEGETTKIEFTSSNYWMEDFKEANPYQTEAHADEEED